jgi:hypothetical protein
MKMIKQALFPQAQIETLSDQVTSFESKLKLNPALTRPQRNELKTRARRVPLALIRQVGALAAPTGQLLGIKLEGTSELLAYADAVNAAHDRITSLFERLEDDLLRQLVAAGETAASIYAAMGRVQRTAEGRSMLDAHREMKGLFRRAKPKKDPTKKPAAKKDDPKKGDANKGDANGTKPEVKDDPPAQVEVQPVA